MKKILSIIFCLFLATLVTAQTQSMLQFEYSLKWNMDEVNPAYEVLSSDLSILEFETGVESEAHADPHGPAEEFTVKVYDEAGKVLFEQKYLLSFVIFAFPVEVVDQTVLAAQTPYTAGMKKIELLKGEEVLNSKEISFCNNNGTCDSFESNLICSADCPADQKDSVCVAEEDDVCDPDCPEGTDADCFNQAVANCGNNVCDSGEDRELCPADCSGVADNFCDGLSDGRCDPDCAIEQDDDCEEALPQKESSMGFFLLVGGVLLAIVVVLFLVVKAVKKALGGGKKKPESKPAEKK